MVRRRHPPITDPLHVGDAFANGFAVQDYEDWMRLVGWADDQQVNGDDGGGAQAVRRKSVAMIVPHSSVRALIDILEASEANRSRAAGHTRRHS